MAYSERLASRVQALVSDRDDVDEQRVFGGLTFMVGTVALETGALRGVTSAVGARAEEALGGRVARVGQLDLRSGANELAQPVGVDRRRHRSAPG